MKNDEFGERMKFFEGLEAKRMFLPMLPVCVRLDGKGFHNWTKGLEKPFDKNFINLMRDTTKWLVEQTNAVLGYVQSDEISLIYYSDKFESQIFFNGRIQKMTSVLASMCSVYFNSIVKNYLPSKVDKPAYFDCRVWQVPNKVEAVNNVLWRNQDCFKNAISMVAQSLFSHKSLQGMSGKQMQERMFQEKGINFNDFETSFKEGSFIQRKTIKTKLTPEELKELPDKHKARNNPDLVIERSKVVFLDLPKFGSIKNRVEVIFDGAEPIVD